jgi:hypothetical protein
VGWRLRDWQNHRMAPMFSTRAASAKSFPGSVIVAFRRLELPLGVSGSGPRCAKICTRERAVYMYNNMTRHDTIRCDAITHSMRFLHFQPTTLQLSHSPLVLHCIALRGVSERHNHFSSFSFSFWLFFFTRRRHSDGSRSAREPNHTVLLSISIFSAAFFHAWIWVGSWGLVI